MRDNMDKILIERPRKAGHEARRVRPPRTHDGWPKFLRLRQQTKEGEAPPAAARKAEPRRLPDGRLAVQEGGIWYGLELETYRLARIGATDDAAAGLAFEVADDVRMEWRDPMIGPVWGHDRDKLAQLAALYGPGWLAVSKRQLSRRDLGRFGLKNCPDPADC